MERDSQIDPVLKAWVDNVLVPALIRQFHAQRITVVDNEQNRMACTLSDISILEQVN